MLALPSFNILKFPHFLLKIKYSYAQKYHICFHDNLEFVLKFCSSCVLVR